MHFFHILDLDVKVLSGFALFVLNVVVECHDALPIIFFFVIVGVN